MNTQAILKLIDKKMNDEYYSNPEPENWNWVLTWAFFENFIESLKNEISSPHSLDIDSLQRYRYTDRYFMNWDKEWDWIKYDDLKKLLLQSNTESI